MRLDHVGKRTVLAMAALVLIAAIIYIRDDTIRPDSNGDCPPGMTAQDFKVWQVNDPIWRKVCR